MAMQRKAKCVVDIDRRLALLNEHGYSSGNNVTSRHLPRVRYNTMKLKQSRYRPGVAQRVPGSYGSHIS